VTPPRRRHQQARPRAARGASRVGARFTVEVGPVAHGGHCVARAEGRVVFVRHALPGETVEIVVTEGGDEDRFWRADAVTVIEASADRVPAPCPYAGPDACGGCDFQHVALPAQRSLKAAVVREQLARLAGLDVAVTVEAVSGDDDGLHWRTRQRYVALPEGRLGMRKHRSHDVVPIDECLLEAPDPPSFRVRDRTFSVDEDGFWQVHPGAPAVLVDTVLSFLDPAAGESVLDLYAGVGIFAAFLADAVGEGARVVVVEADREACRHAQRNLGRSVEVAAGAVDRVLTSAYDEPFDLVVLDPPREGAKRMVVEQVVDRAPRAVAYVACDPAALARDVRWFGERGYAMGSLRAFDLFPMTHHVECVAILEPA
jgi:tRNA/tmRNA/rRNA uracil-C5-methylase (TrmA/RlmC/RlmD family)